MSTFQINSNISYQINTQPLSEDQATNAFGGFSKIKNCSHDTVQNLKTEKEKERKEGSQLNESTEASKPSRLLKKPQTSVTAILSLT